MSWNIITDSSSDLFDLEESLDGVTMITVPFVIRVDDTDYVDDEDLNVKKMLDHMTESQNASTTSCPAPGEWLDAFETPGKTIVLTISGNLSGSYNSACAAKDMLLEEEPDKQIEILDSLSTGPEIVLCVRKICRSISEGKDFDEVVAEARAFQKRTRIVFALSSYNNLMKNGRMSRIKGFLAGKLGLIGVGIGSEEGTIKILGVSRGQRKAVKAILTDIKERGIRGKDIVISHCQNLEFAKLLKDSVLKAGLATAVTIMPTRGLCSYYAEIGGLIVGF